MTHTDPTLSILIVSYNTAAMTRACLDSLADGARQTRFEVVVVDNASSDGSAEMIAAHPLGVRLIALEENIGFARANNLAARKARGELLLLLNPDTIVEPGAIDRLIAFSRARPEAGVWGGRTVFADGRLNPSSVWARMSLWSLACRASGIAALLPTSSVLNPEAYGGWARDREREVDIVTGCFLLITRRLWCELGGFDTAFFMYGEDADLCLRARALGMRPAMTPEAQIVHHGGASEPTRAGKMVKLLTAKATLIRRHFAPALVPPGLLLLAAWPLSRFLAYAVAVRFGWGKSCAREFQVWREVLSARAEWLAGYGPRGEEQLEVGPRREIECANGRPAHSWSAQTS